MTIRTRPLLLALLASACSGDETEALLPPTQAEGSFFTYAADDAILVCEGTVPGAEAWMRAVAVRLTIDPDSILPTTYNFVDSALLEQLCSTTWGGCTRRIGDRIEILSTRPLRQTELVHAIVLSAWPRRSAMLERGLATAFDDREPATQQIFTAEQIDAAIAYGELSDAGTYLVHGMLNRYSPEAFAQFWHAIAEQPSVGQFRATFEDVFGEPLDALIDAAVYESMTCPIPICVGEPTPWNQGAWTTESPSACGDSVTGLAGTDHYEVTRAEYLEIAEPGSYDVSVSEHASAGQGIHVTACDERCGQYTIWAGESLSLEFTPGLVRVETIQGDAEDTGVAVEIRPSN